MLVPHLVFTATKLVGLLHISSGSSRATETQLDSHEEHD